MSSDPIRRVNIAAIACEPRPSCPTVFSEAALALERRLVRLAPG